MSGAYFPPSYFPPSYFVYGYFVPGAEASAPAASPTPAPASSPMSDNGWTDRDLSYADFLEEVARMQTTRPFAFTVDVQATQLHVDVRANMLAVDVVERGNDITFIAPFSCAPEEIHFVYIRPGENRPVADPGYGHPDSKITEIEEGVFSFTLDTFGFRGGDLHWHFWGRSPNESAFGTIKIPERKSQLL